MKKILLYLPLVLLIWGCEKDKTYPGGSLSPYIAIFDVRDLYKEKPITLNQDNMRGASRMAVMVVSDHSGGNLPEGMLIVQDARRLSKLRGIAISLGDAAKDYVPGDSLIIDIQGAVLQRTDGILQLNGITTADITRISSGNTVPVTQVTTAQLLANPGNYESTLGVVVKGGFDPLPASTDVLAGDKILNDGFGNITLRTAATAAFSQTIAPVSANFYGIFFDSTLRMRTGKDYSLLSSVVEIAPVVITGYMPNVTKALGVDANYEYIQLMATRDIDFAATPFAVVTTNNANASTPTGYPAQGWATGGKRTYKFSLDSGKVTKGSFFYVGGDGKRINGEKSTDISNAIWICAFNYSKLNGDGFGAATTNLLANSGNASGIAVFADSAVTVNSKPVDVIFIATGGSLFSEGKGYRIATTDFYDLINPLTLEEQPFYRQGSNTMSLAYQTADQGIFNILGGVYNVSLGKWVQARAQVQKTLNATSTLTDIEGEGATTLK